MKLHSNDHFKEVYLMIGKSVATVNDAIKDYQLKKTTAEHLDD